MLSQRKWRHQRINRAGFEKGPERWQQFGEKGTATHWSSLFKLPWPSVGDTLECQTAPPLLPSPNFIHPKNTEPFRKSLFNLKSLVDILPCVKEAIR